MSFSRKLHKESEGWVKANLIDSETRDRILSHYPVRTLSLEAVLLFCAALFVGCSLFLFIAHNWAYLGQTVQFCTVISVLIAIFVFRDFMDFKDQHLAARALDLLSGLAGGVGIWLTAQIFHIGGHFPNGLWLWAVMVIGLAWFRRENTLIYLGLGLTFYWQIQEYYSFYTSGLSAPLLLGSLGILIHCQRLWESLLLPYVASVHIFLSHLVFFYGHRKVYGEHEPACLFLLLVLLCLARQLLLNEDEEWPQRTSLLYRLLSIALFLFSFKDLASLFLFYHFENPLSSALVLLYSILVLVFFAKALKTNRFSPEPRVVFPSIVFLIWLSGTIVQMGAGKFYVGPYMAFVSTIAFFLLGLFLLRYGAEKRSSGTMQEGLALLVLLAIARYIEYFGEYLDGSIFFFMLACILIWASRKMRINPE